MEEGFVKNSGRGSKEKFALRMLRSLMKYKESGFFRWIGNHQGLSMALVGAWGLLILIMFFWFVFTKVANVSDEGKPQRIQSEQPNVNTGSQNIKK